MAVKNANAKTWSLSVEWDGKRYSDPEDVPEQPSPIDPPTLSSPVLGSSSASVSFTGGGGYATLIPQYSINSTDWVSLVSDLTSPLSFFGLAPETFYYFRALPDGDDGLESNVVTGTTSAISEFQLAAGHFEPQKIPAQIIQPRPDVERSSYSRWSYAYPGIEFEAPVVILGGAYPGMLEIISRSGTADTANASVGSTREYGIGRAWYGTQDQKDYLIFRWTPDSEDNGNTYSFTLRWTGQDGVQVERTFSGVVSIDKFRFVDLDASPGGDGSLASPYQDTTDGWWTDGLHGDKFMVYRGRSGTYAAFPTSNWTSSTPRVHMRYPGDAGRWKLDGTAKDYLLGSSMDDMWVSGMYVAQGPGTAVTQARFFECGTSTADWDRPVFWDNYFFDGRVGSTATDNNGWVIAMRQGTDHYHAAVVGNTFDTCNSSSNGFGTFTAFECRDYVYEHNIVKNWTGETMVQAKDSNAYISIRANDFWDNNRSYVRIANQAAGSIDMEYQEVCWNYMRRVGGTGSVIQWNGQFSGTGDFSPQWQYRNCAVGSDKVASEYRSFSATNAETFYAAGNALVAPDNPWSIRDGSTPIDTSGSTDAEAEAFMTAATFDNIFASSMISRIDATTGQLIGSWASYVGTYGADPI